jgi:hypothetical protein
VALFQPWHRSSMERHLPRAVASSRKAAVRRAPSTLSVDSEIGWNTPPTSPDSTRIGEKEKVMKASSR